MEHLEQGEHQRRRFPRVRKRRPVVLQHDGDRNRLTFASLDTVGRGGALLRCDEPVPVEAEVELAICLAGGVIRARARVLYHVRDQAGLGLGVEFLDLSPAGSELLEQLIERGSSDPPTTDGRT